ncbi:MAG: DOMON-like domain-containing protein [Synechococcus sp. BS307-5m-G39]|nr:DOMON-like domain-containing protein [Synechococcus sp. BS307-5m-G39]MBL6800604.1 DOMON-like domain-containing protein [Synechococcus sp. BS307-5m-G37]
MARHPVMVRQVCPLVPFSPDASPKLLASAEFVWEEHNTLELSFSLRPSQSGQPLPTLKFTSAAPGSSERSGQRLDGLWEHTCFEAFFALPNQDRYWELNVSPSGDWNLYRFENYRSKGAREQTLEPRIHWQNSQKDCRCTIVLRLDPWWTAVQLPELAIAMVLEDSDNNLSYWALSHHGDEPDFHDRRGFLTP